MTILTTEFWRKR